MTEVVYQDKKLAMFTGSLREGNKVKVMAEFEIEAALPGIDNRLEKLYSKLDDEPASSHNYITENDVKIYVLGPKSKKVKKDLQILLMRDTECDKEEDVQNAAQSIITCYREIIEKIGSQKDKQHIQNCFQDITKSLQSLTKMPSEWRYPHTIAGFFGCLPQTLFDGLDLPEEEKGL